jgi:hypothetical protein
MAALKSVLGALIEKPLQRFGYQIVPEAPFLDLTGTTNDAIEALYCSRRQPFLIDIDVTRLRGHGALGLVLDRGIGHPFIDTMAAYGLGQQSGYAGSAVEKFYRDWTPASAVDALGLDAAAASSALRQLPPYATLLPWFQQNPDEFLAIRESWIRAELSDYGARLDPEHGGLENGPWSPIKGAYEYQRIVSVYDSIRERGYVPAAQRDAHIYGHLLIDGDDWCVLLRNGNHRASALVALGWTRIPVLVISGTETPRRLEAAHWPNVRNGVFTLDQATAVFDRVFAGTRPSRYMHTSDPPVQLAQ